MGVWLNVCQEFSFIAGKEDRVLGNIRRKAVFSLVSAGEDKRASLWPFSGTLTPNSRAIQKKRREASRW